MPSSLPSRSYVPPVYGPETDLGGGMGSIPGGISRAPGSAPPTPVIGIGGMLSRPNDAFHRFLLQNAPDSTTYIPIGTLGMKKANEEMRAKMSELEAQRMKYVLIGHSLGGTAIHNMEQEPPDRYGRYTSDPTVPYPSVGELYRLVNGVPASNTNYGSIKVDAPYNPPWQKAPRWIKSMVPVAGAISKSSDSIQYDPGLVDWTGGNTVMRPWTGQSPAHNPFANPTYPGNQSNLDALQALLRQQMNAYTNVPPTTEVGRTTIPP